ARDVDDPGAVVVRDEELRDREAEAGGEAGGPDLPHRLAARHRPDEPERDDEREEGELPAGHGREGLDVEPGDGGEYDDRRPERAVGHGRRVADERDAGREERPEAEADEHRGRDGDRRAEARGPLDERPEREGDQEGLDPTVVR